MRIALAALLFLCDVKTGWLLMVMVALSVMPSMWAIPAVIAVGLPFCISAMHRLDHIFDAENFREGGDAGTTSN